MIYLAALNASVLRPPRSPVTRVKGEAGERGWEGVAGRTTGHREKRWQPPGLPEQCRSEF